MRHAILLLLALPLAAQEPDAAKRYHDAYVLEVLEGKIADAAKGYLALVEDAATPSRLRHQSEFRLAVCIALLNRPDEARVRLAGLRTRDGLDDALRAQVDQYLRGLGGVAPGSALNKRLEDLTFELGRVAPSFGVEPAVYRDFIILGDKARPHLRELLTHADARVREHALRILMRMKEPGMARHWETGFTAALQELRTYVEKRPAERAALEPTFLRLQGTLLYGLGKLGNIAWSPAFIANVAARGGKFREKAAGLAQWRIKEPEIRALFDRWLADDEMARPAALAFLSVMPGTAEAPVATPERFGRVTAALGETAVGDDRAVGGLTRYAGHVDAGLVLDRLAAWVENAKKIEMSNGHPMRGEVGHALADALDDRELTAAQRKRYREVVLAWIRWLADENRGTWFHQDFSRHVRAALAGAPDADAVLRGLASGPLRDVRRVTWLTSSLRFLDPKDLAWFDTILLATDGQAQQVLVGQLKNALESNPRPGLEVWRELGRRGPAWLAALGGNGVPSLAQMLAGAGQILGPVEGLALMRRCVRISLEAAPSVRTQIVGAWFSPSFRNAFQARVLLPVADEVMEALPEQTQEWFAGILASQLRVNTDIADRVRASMARVVLDHVEHVGSPAERAYITSNETLFPPELWIHRVSGRMSMRASMATSTAARVLADPTLATEKLVHVLATHDDTFIDRLVERADGAVVARVAAALKPDNVRGETAERALAKVLASEPVDLDALGHLAQVVAEIRASDRLVPVARRLLRAEPTRSVKLGITLARSLAKNELRPDLVGLLDSPDANIRNAAKEALESIAEWNRFKAEMKLRERK